MKTWMKRSRLKQGEVAAATKHSREYINRVANGKEQPSANFITTFYFVFGQEATIAAFDDAEPQA